MGRSAGWRVGGKVAVEGHAGKTIQPAIFLHRALSRLGRTHSGGPVLKQITAALDLAVPLATMPSKSLSQSESPATPAQEGNPIVQVASLFNQLLHHFPADGVCRPGEQARAERDAKGFACWMQFVSMLFCQLGRADPLREICNGLARCPGRLVHLGIAKAPCRPTLSYANEHGCGTLTFPPDGVKKAL